jgi:uncharacterized protein (TIRG00374 family)
MYTQNIGYVSPLKINVKQKADLTSLVKPGRLMLPFVISLGVIAYLFFSNVKENPFKGLVLNSSMLGWLMLALLMIVIRDFAYMLRIRVLTGDELSWRKSFQVIMLWEFCSAIVPQLLGGGFAFAIILLNGERIKLGKSIAVVLFSSFLDGLFFALIAPIVYFWFGKEQLFSNINANSTQKLAMGDTLMYTFWTIYFIVLIYKLIVAYVLFFNARRIKQIAYKLFSFPFLKKWKRNVVETMQEMEIASIELKSATIGYWIKSFAATLLSWSARFILINCIISAFNTIPFDHFLLYARQSIMGILNIGTPTPGGAGFAEFMFTNFLGEFISNASLTVTLAFVWRLFSYYPYLIVGAIVLPRWIARVYGKPKPNE